MSDTNGHFAKGEGQPGVDSHPGFISAGAPSSSGDPAVYFRKEFRADAGLLRATLKITALGVVVP